MQSYSMLGDTQVQANFITSPGFLHCKLPKNCINELKTTLNKMYSGEIEMVDNRPQGERHLTKETKMPIGPLMKKFTEDLAYKYDEVFKGGDNLFADYFFVDDLDKIVYDTKAMWVNHSYKYDFNPVHRHEGMFAFVIWVKIPYDIEEELKRHQGNASQTSCFAIHYTNSCGRLITKILEIDKSFEWNIILFDAFLPHSVLPFYTSDDVRISIAGDIFATLKE